jgi:spoIIIJ-associated protein
VEEVEKVRRTVNEAVEQALAELGIETDQALVEVLKEPSRGLFGILGARPAKVRVRVKETPSQRARQLLEEIFRAMDLMVEMRIEEKDRILLIDMQGAGLGALIGKRGETLDALQYLVNLGINKGQEERCKVVLDVEGYRTRREQTLEDLALKLAEKARQRGRNVVLEPMNSRERRIIHTVLQGVDDIYAYSEGEEPYRKIVISPKR